MQPNVRSSKRELRSNETISLETLRENGTFHDYAVRLSNSLPEIVRSCSDYITFLSFSSKLLIDRAEQRNRFLRYILFLFCFIGITQQTVFMYCNFISENPSVMDLLDSNYYYYYYNLLQGLLHVGLDTASFL